MTNSTAQIGYQIDDHYLTNIPESKAPTNLISYDGKREALTCSDVRSSNIKDICE